MKIGCCVAIEHIPLAKAYGYQFVELSARAIMEMDDQTWIIKRNEILQYDIPVLGFSSFCDERTPIIGPFANENTWGMYLDTVLERASQLHIKTVGIGAPKARKIPEDYDYERATKEMEYFLLTAAKKASHYNITILYEALNPKTCNFGTHTQEIYHSVKAVGHPNLKIVYDVYHAINANESYEDARYCFDEIRHIHINSWDHKRNRYFLFQQDIPYVKELCLFLRSVSYDRTISIEAFNADFIHTGAASVPIMNEAIAFAAHPHTDDDISKR